MSNNNSNGVPSAGTIKKISWLYFIAMVAQMIGGTIAGTYLVFYMTSRMLIAAGVMGTILLLSRIIDLIIGVIAAPVVQKLCFKHGQYRSWLLYGPLLVSIGTTLCFINPNIPMMGKAVIVFVGYLGYGGGMSFVQLAQNTMMAKVAGPDVNARITISSKMIQGQNTGTIIASMITLPLITMVDGMGMDGYTVIQIIFAIIGFVGQFFLFLGTKEFDKASDFVKPSASGAGNENMVKKYIDTLKNPQLVVIILAEMLRWGIMMTLISLVMYYFSYIIGDPGMMTVSMTVQSVLALLFSFVAPSIVKKTGKKMAAILTGILGVIGYTCIALFAQNGPWFYIGFNAIAAAGQALINVCGANLFLDCAEYQLYKTGKDNRTYAMSLFGVAVKLGFIISSAVVAVVLSAAQYDEVAATFGNPRAFVLLIGGIPAIVNVLYVLLYTFGYKITEEKSKEYAAANFARAQQNAGK